MKSDPLVCDQSGVTVAELIDWLAMIPLTYRVAVPGYESGIEPVRLALVVPVARVETDRHGGEFDIYEGGTPVVLIRGRHDNSHSHRVFDDSVLDSPDGVMVD